MRKILIGLVAVVVIAAGGWFGFLFYVQHRVVAEVDTAFAQIRAAGGKASHGKVAFDLWTRTLNIADIIAESAAQPPISVKIGSLTALGVSQPDPAQFSAASIEIADLEVSLSGATETVTSIIYTAPRITVRNYSGPASAPPVPVSSSLVDLYRAAFDQVTSMSADQIAAPTLTGRMKFSPAMQGGTGTGEFIYSGFAMEGLKNGRIASTTTREAVLKVAQPGDTANTVTVSMADFAAYDTDFKVMAAIFDPQKSGDEQYYPVYRQISTGPYTIKFDQSLSGRIEGFTINDVAMRPSRLQLPALMAMMPPAGAKPPTPAQTRAMLEKAAGVYEGVRIGNAEMRGLSLDLPNGPFKLAAMRFNFENGKIGEFAVEGLEGRSPQGPVKVGRFALKSFDVAGMMRASSQFAAPGQQPSPDQLLALLPLLEGAELTGLVAPYKNTTTPVNIETVSLNWGQFIGPIPSKARVIAKLTAPVDATDPSLAPLIAGGIRSAAVNLDIGAAWSESARSFVVEPVIAELGGVLSASARVSLGNVPREVFSTNPLQAAVMAAQIEAGAVEITLRDLGGIDLALTQFARAQNVSRQAARDAMIAAIQTSAARMAAANPDVQSVADALVRFISTPQGSLTIKLTPQGKVPMMQLVNALKTDPLAALAKFQVTASTGL